MKEIKYTHPELEIIVANRISDFIREYGSEKAGTRTRKRIRREVYAEHGLRIIPINFKGQGWRVVGRKKKKHKSKLECQAMGELKRLSNNRQFLKTLK